MKYWRDSECQSCGYVGVVDIHHIKTRKSGGGDEIENTLDLCRQCHSEVHSFGLGNFIELNKGNMHRLDLEPVIIKKGWQYCELQNKWKRY